MKPRELSKAFDGDIDAVAEAISCDRSTAHRILNSKRLVPLLRAQLATQRYPLKFPNAVNLQDYLDEANRDARKRVRSQPRR